MYYITILLVQFCTLLIVQLKPSIRTFRKPHQTITVMVKTGRASVRTVINGSFDVLAITSLAARAHRFVW